MTPLAAPASVLSRLSFISSRLSHGMLIWLTYFTATISMSWFKVLGVVSADTENTPADLIQHKFHPSQIEPANDASHFVPLTLYMLYYMALGADRPATAWEQENVLEKDLQSEWIFRPCHCRLLWMPTTACLSASHIKKNQHNFFVLFFICFLLHQYFLHFRIHHYINMARCYWETSKISQSSLLGLATEVFMKFSFINTSGRKIIFCSFTFHCKKWRASSFYCYQGKILWLCQWMKRFDLIMVRLGKHK